MSASDKDTLPPEAKKRYLEKISLIGDIDPYKIDVSADLVVASDFPPIDACDIVLYLVLQTSFTTMKQFKARKSLKAYNQFTNGWVKDVKSWKIHDKSVVMGKVSNGSMKTNLTCTCLGKLVEMFILM